MYNLSHLQLSLLERGIIDLDGGVDEDMFRYVRECLTRLAAKDSPPPISVEITSVGGEYVFGLFIYDLLRLYRGNTTATVTGVARSAAAIILQACDKRVCTKNSLILVHNVRRSSVELDEINDTKVWEKIVEGMRAKQERLYVILAERTKKSRDEIFALCKQDRDLSAEEALEFGLIDEII